MYEDFNDLRFVQSSDKDTFKSCKLFFATQISNLSAHGMYAFIEKSFFAIMLHAGSNV